MSAQALRIDAAGTVPHAAIRAFAAWTDHGCAAATHRGYVRRVQQVFAEGVATLGLWPQSTLAEAVHQLKRCRMDKGGFFAASLNKFILFLGVEGTDGLHHSAKCAGGNNRSLSGSAMSPRVNRRPTKKRPAPACRAALPAAKVHRNGVYTPHPHIRLMAADELLPIMENLLRWVASIEEAAPFRVPVSELYRPEQIPGYDSRVKRRMDLRTVAQKLARLEYSAAGFHQFRADVCLCFYNCISYVPNPNDPFFKKSVFCLKRFEARFAEVVSKLHFTAQGGLPMSEMGRRHPASHEQRRYLRAAARKAGVILLPFVALSEYYSPDPRLRAGFTVTRQRHERKHLAGKLYTVESPTAALGTPDAKPAMLTEPSACPAASSLVADHRQPTQDDSPPQPSQSASSTIVLNGPSNKTDAVNSFTLINSDATVATTGTTTQPELAQSHQCQCEASGSSVTKPAKRSNFGLPCMLETSRRMGMVQSTAEYWNYSAGGTLAQLKQHSASDLGSI